MRIALFALLTLASLFSRAQQPAMPPAKEAIHKLETDIPVLLEKSDVPGMSIALIRDGRLVWSKGFGVSNAVTKKPVTTHTIFEAASLSKPVFAYAVLRLVDEGKLNLDTPLNKYLGNNYDVVGDERINLITARHVLSHTSGFPNWRDNDRTKTLLIHFNPGEKWSYSGEGMVYLSKVVEKITGMRFEAFMQKYALQPLGMTASSYIWRNRFDSLKAYRHDELGALSGRNQPNDGKEDTLHDDGNAAASLQTTPEDYAKFIVAVLNGTGLKKATWQQMLTPQVRVNPKYPPIAWGLGVGLETMPEGTYFWHWGDNGDAKAYVTAFLPNKSAVVYFADGSNGLAFTREVLDDAIGGEHPALAHLSYDRYNSPSRLLTKAILTKGVADAMKDYREQRARTGDSITEGSMNQLGYLLIRLKKLDAAIAVFTQNTEDHPGSWNVWDSLAEAYMDKGDKDQAVKYYEKSLQLNPDNTNGANQLKKLKQGS
ncbi:MAG TPA: serine hydrolase [Puia sp.]|jgi:CubicO group peptidase (beta-lactamase class C family)|nr:serine hydrolase [Puia sp.]